VCVCFVLFDVLFHYTVADMVIIVTEPCMF